MKSITNDSEKIDVFSEKFFKNFPNFWPSKHFQRVEIISRGIGRDEIFLLKCAQTQELLIKHSETNKDVQGRRLRPFNREKCRY